MSKSRDQTDDTQPLSSGEKTEDQAQQSKPSASLGSTQTSTPTSSKPSATTSAVDNTLTTPPTTPQITEKIRQHAMLMRVTIKVLERSGLIKRYRVLSSDMTTLKEIRIVLDPTLWTDDLQLKEQK